MFGKGTLEKWANNRKEEYSGEVQYIESRSTAILDVIMAYAKLDFKNKTEVTDREDVFDAIAFGVNRLGEELEKSVVTLQEREALLQEVHHRVKNNLQIISSLLNLQASYTQDQKFLELIRECKNRIASMAMIHEMLYMTDNLSRINVSEYIKTLTFSIYHSFMANEIPEIEFVYEIEEEIYLEADKMIPLGLIINEVVSNSFKYAFPRQSGEVFIRFKKEQEDYFMLIKDNGVGLSEKAQSLCSERLGLQLIKALSEQISASLNIIQEDGLGYELIFKIDN